jgi:hypothetical protein
MPLSLSVNHLDGELRLLVDSRLTPKLRQDMWETSALDVSVGDDQQLAAFKSVPPRNALVQIVSKDGAVVEAKELERPLVKLTSAKLYGDSRLTYIVTVDYSAGFGSYSGPITFLVEVPDRHLKWIEATDEKTGVKKQISLMTSLKTTWEWINSPDGKGKQILHAACRPTAFGDNHDFTISYTRFYFDGTKWIELSRSRKGYSDFEDGFPERNQFP